MFNHCKNMSVTYFPLSSNKIDLKPLSAHKYSELRLKTGNNLENNTSYFVGAYVPLTANGKILVDGMLVSCYADFDHDLAHMMVTPMEMFAEVMEWIFGNYLGFPVYVGTARQLGQLILPDGQYWTYSFQHSEIFIPFQTNKKAINNYF